MEFPAVQLCRFGFVPSDTTDLPGNIDPPLPPRFSFLASGLASATGDWKVIGIVIYPGCPWRKSQGSTANTFNSADFPGQASYSDAIWHRQKARFRPVWWIPFSILADPYRELLYSDVPSLLSAATEEPTFRSQASSALWKVSSWSALIRTDIMKGLGTSWNENFLAGGVSAFARIASEEPLVLTLLLNFTSGGFWTRTEAGPVPLLSVVSPMTLCLGLAGSSGECIFDRISVSWATSDPAVEEVLTKSLWFRWTCMNSGMSGWLDVDSTINSSFCKQFQFLNGRLIFRPTGQILLLGWFLVVVDNKHVVADVLFIIGWLKKTARRTVGIGRVVRVRHVQAAGQIRNTSARFALVGVAVRQMELFKRIGSSAWDSNCRLSLYVLYFENLRISKERPNLLRWLEGRGLWPEGSCVPNWAINPIVQGLRAGSGRDEWAKSLVPVSPTRRISLGSFPTRSTRRWYGDSSAVCMRWWRTGSVENLSNSSVRLIVSEATGGVRLTGGRAKM